jgi:hypothetical protein
MTRKTLLQQVRDIEMARNCCLLAGNDPDEVVAGYFVDATGQRQRVSKARWRWYQGVCKSEAADGVAYESGQDLEAPRPKGTIGLCKREI